MSEILDEVYNIIQPIILGLDLELVDLEYHSSGRKGLLRIFIDKIPAEADEADSRPSVGSRPFVGSSNTPAGSRVSVDDCALVSKMVSRALDYTDIFPFSYRLEVSSPGIDRPLKKEEDFVRFKEQLCRIKTFAPLSPYGQRKIFSGRLKGINDGVVVLETQEQIFEIPKDRIAKANLIPEI